MGKKNKMENISIITGFVNSETNFKENINLKTSLQIFENYPWQKQREEMLKSEDTEIPQINYLSSSGSLCVVPCSDQDFTIFIDVIKKKSLLPFFTKRLSDQLYDMTFNQVKEIIINFVKLTKDEFCEFIEKKLEEQKQQNQRVHAD